MLYASRANLLLPVELVHEPTGTIIEVDEHGALHVVPSGRARALSRRRDGRLRRRASTRRCAANGAARTDGLTRGLAAKGFGFGGLQRERAYHDALFDLATPAMGHPPLDPDRGASTATARPRTAATAASLRGAQRFLSAAVLDRRSPRR